jgi:hypothetical protein
VVDLVFVVDSSTKSSGSTAWTNMTSFVNIIINAVWQTCNVRVSFIRYSDSAQIMFGLNSYSDRTAVTNAVSGVSYTGGGSNLAAALELARNQVFNQARSGAWKVILFITDTVPGQPPESVQLLLLKSYLDKACIRMYGVCVTDKNAINADIFYRLSYNDAQYAIVWTGKYHELSAKTNEAVKLIRKVGKAPAC